VLETVQSHFAKMNKKRYTDNMLIALRNIHIRAVERLVFFNRALIVVLTRISFMFVTNVGVYRPRMTRDVQTVDADASAVAVGRPPSRPDAAYASASFSYFAHRERMRTQPNV